MPFLNHHNKFAKKFEKTCSNLRKITNKSISQRVISQRVLCVKDEVSFRPNMGPFSPFLEQNVHHIWERALRSQRVKGNNWSISSLNLNKLVDYRFICKFCFLTITVWKNFYRLTWGTSHGVWVWILFTNFPQLSIDTRWHPWAVSKVYSILSSEKEVSTTQAPSFLEEAGTLGGGIISLTTSSLPTNVIFTFLSLVVFLTLFTCFWTPLKPFCFFDYPFKTDWFFS